MATLTADAVLDKVNAAFAGTQAELLTTSLSGEKERLLREVFAAG
jgi:uncharacterized membrane protein